jgi:hypothetical protein
MAAYSRRRVSSDVQCMTVAGTNGCSGCSVTWEVVVWERVGTCRVWCVVDGMVCVLVLFVGRRGFVVVGEDRKGSGDVGRDVEIE